MAAYINISLKAIHKRRHSALTDTASLRLCAALRPATPRVQPQSGKSEKARDKERGRTSKRAREEQRKRERARGSFSPHAKLTFPCKHCKKNCVLVVAAAAAAKYFWNATTRWQIVDSPKCQMPRILRRQESANWVWQHYSVKKEFRNFFINRKNMFSI